MILLICIIFQIKLLIKIFLIKKEILFIKSLKNTLILDKLEIIMLKNIKNKLFKNHKLMHIF